MRKNQSTLPSLLIYFVTCLFLPSFYSTAYGAVVMWDGGAANGNWSSAANWSGDILPGSADVATFNSTSTKDCTIDVNIDVAGLDIKAPYTGTITQASAVTATLGSSGYKQANGTFVASNDSLTVGGNWSRLSGTFAAGDGTITFNGSGNRTVDFGSSQTLGTVEVAKNGGTLTFSLNGFTATTLSVSSGDAVKFQSGKSFQVTHLTLNGSAGSPINLDSTQPLHPWQLDASSAGTQTISFVKVKHSDASPGAIIHATDNCTDLGLNTNWDFGVAPTLKYATAEPGNLTQVYLRYGEAMDTATAADTAHYTLSGGLSVTAAAISSDKKLVTLSSSGDVTLGTTTVTASSAIQSLVGRNLPETTRTIEEGNSNGIPTALEVKLSLSTDDNQSVIQQAGPFIAFDIPNQGLRFTLTLTAPGTAKTTVGMGQIQEPGGASLVTLNGKTSAMVITSGGTPNTAKVTARAVTRGAFKDDFTLRAFVGTEERGVKPATVIKVDVIHSCLYLADQRSVEQKAQVTPPMGGLKLTSQSWLVDKLHASPTSRLAAPAWSLTDASGQATRAFKPCGVLAYCVFTNEVVATEDIGEGEFSDYQEIQTSKESGPDVTVIPIGKTENRLLPSCYTQGPQDGNKKPKNKTGETIYLSLGEKVLDLQDLAISGRGLDYEFRRVYRSFNYRGNLALKDFGENWTYSYADERLVKDGTGPELSANVINFRDGHSGAVFVNTGPGKWAAPLQNFVQLRVNPVTGDFEIREESGLERIYFPFTDPNRAGRLKELRDRNGNRLTFHYEKINPGASLHEKFVLTRLIDTLGREIRYQYYAETSQTVSGRVLTILHPTTNTAAYGRLAHVTDFKGDMNFDGTAESEDFPGQANSRTLTFDYDTEGNLIRVTSPAVSGTPQGNDFLNGKTFRYKYLTTGDLPGGLSDEQKNRLLHKLTHIWYPNEVKENLGSNPADPEAAEEVTYETDKTDPFLGYPIAYRAGGANGNGVDSGGTMTYTWTDLNPDRHMPVGVSVDPTRLFNVPTHKVVVVDRNANSAEYIYGGGRNLLEYREFTRGFRSSEPSHYLFTFRYNKDLFPTQRVNPLGNKIQFVFNDKSPDRFQQGNLIRIVQTPDAARGGNQPTIEQVFVYEPIYNRPCLFVQARGSNITQNGFTPPIPDLLDRTMTDPYDPTKALNVRYARVEFFDFQESPTEADQWPATSGSPLAGQIVDGKEVLATEVLLLRELGLPETTAGLQTLRSRLAANLTRLGLGDLNADGIAVPVVAGNIVRTVLSSPVILPGSNQRALEKTIDPVDLIRQDKGYMEGGTNEGGEGTRLQTVVTMYQYNGFGQLIKTISPEGNVTTLAYFPELNPDGDLINTPPPADGRTLDPSTGGYLQQTVADTTRSYFDQDGNDKSGATFNNNGTNPLKTDIRTRYTYDDVGNVITSTDGRGIRTDQFVNEQDEVVQTTEAADISGASSADPSDPLVGASIGPLTAFAYKTRTFFDYNGNVVLTQTEERGNTSSVDGSGLGILPTQAIDTTPGLLNADTPGGDAFVDTLNLYDRIDDLIEVQQEVKSSVADLIGVQQLNSLSVPEEQLLLQTRYRYDGNQNRVLTIYPEGNADGAVYDERDLLFKRIQGTDARPSAGLYAPGDPTTFNRLGGAGTIPSTTTYNYDKNRNLTEIVDAADTDLNPANRSTISGAGDATKITYDGFDRRKTLTDPNENKTTYFYDPDSNIVRVLKDGDPVDDIKESGDRPPNPNKTLEVTEYIHDELSRVIVTHRVLFRTPDLSPARPPTLTDTPDMDLLAAYLGGLTGQIGDEAIVPGSLNITVLGRVTTLTEYDRESRITFFVEDDLDVTRTDYDGADRAIRITDSTLANGFSAGAFHPDALSGNIMQIAYDDNHNEIERLETDVATLSGINSETFRTTSLYDSLDRLQTQVDPLGHTMDYRYDSRGNLVAAADAQGPVGSRMILRRGLGNTGPVLVNDFGNVSIYFYDGLSRKLKDRSILTASGQGDGIHIGATLEGVKDTTPIPDPSQGGGDGLVDVFYVWDDNSLLKHLTDDQGNRTLYTYDNIDRKLTATYGAVVPPALANRDDTDRTDTLTYDPDHNVKTFTDQNGTVTTNIYDALNRLKRFEVTLLSSYGDGDGGVPIKVIGAVPSGTYTANSYQYDGLSRRTQAFDANLAGTADDSFATWAYDSLSRLIEESQKIGTISTRFISHSFNIAVSKAKYTYSTCAYPDGRQVDSTYDRLDRLVSRNDREGATAFPAMATYDYVGTYRTLRRSLQNGVHLDLTQGTGTTYDGERRPLQWRHHKVGSLRIGFGHQDGSGAPAYDRMDNKLIEEKLHDPANSEVYVYDSLYRLTRPSAPYRAIAHAFRRGTLNAAKIDIATLTSTLPVLKTKDWDLDGVGNWQKNITEYAAGGFTGGTQTRLDTSFNEYHAIGGSAQDNDHNGNLIDGGASAPAEYALPETQKRFEWDYRNRLRKVFKNNATPTDIADDTLIATYLYDGVNRRIRKETTGAAVQGATQTDYLFDFWQIVEEHDTLAGDVITQQYVYGNHIDEPLVLDNRRNNVTVADLNDGAGNQRHFYHQNTLYHVYGLTDETGTLVETYLYDPYGRHFVSTGGVYTDAGTSIVNNPYLFTGRYFDPETKLLDFRNRIYSPMRGQFISRDPIAYLAGSLGLYEYVGSAPTYWEDPYGLGNKRHWHHRLVRQFFKFLQEDLGIDINDPQYGRKLARKLHQRLHSLGYNKDWEKWLVKWLPKQWEKGKPLTIGPVMKQLKKLETSERYRKILACGKQTTTRYKSKVVQSITKVTPFLKKTRIPIIAIGLVAVQAVSAAADEGVTGAVKSVGLSGVDIVTGTAVTAGTGLAIVKGAVLVGTEVTVGGAAVTTIAGASGVGTAVGLVGYVGYEFGGVIGTIPVYGTEQTITDWWGEAIYKTAPGFWAWLE